MVIYIYDEPSKLTFRHISAKNNHNKCILAVYSNSEESSVVTLNAASFRVINE